MLVLPNTLSQPAGYEAGRYRGEDEGTWTPAGELLELIQHRLRVMPVEVLSEGPTPLGQHSDQLAGRGIRMLSRHRVKLLRERVYPVGHLPMLPVDLVPHPLSHTDAYPVRLARGGMGDLTSLFPGGQGQISTRIPGRLDQVSAGRAGGVDQLSGGVLPCGRSVLVSDMLAPASSASVG